MKVKELKDDDRKNLLDELDAKSVEMGIGDQWEQPKSLSNYQALKEVIGICYNCEHLSYCKTQYGNVKAKCCIFELWLTGKDRIVDCNEHSERGTLSLRDMASMATLIDPHKKEVKGFT